MCGRFSLSNPKAIPVKNLGIESSFIKKLQPRYNIAPGQPVCAMTHGQKSDLQFLRWGLIPSWAKDSSVGYRMINAKSETLLEKPSFREAFLKRRCLIFADGFYEWSDVASEGSKRPYYIRLKSKDIFAVAGLWDLWKSSEGQTIASCTIITCSPNDSIKRIHPRMPVLLPKDHWLGWISDSTASADELQKFLAPYPAKETEIYAVSKFVNTPSNDTPECLQPVAA